MLKYMILSLLFTASFANAAPKLQDSDFATQAQILGAGGSINQLLNTQRIYDDIDGVTLDTQIAIWNAKLSSPVSLTSQVSGVLPILNGGTNNSSAAVNGAVVY